MSASAFTLNTKPPRGAVAHVVLARGSIAACGVSGATAPRGSCTRLCAKCRAWLLAHAGADVDVGEAAA